MLLPIDAFAFRNEFQKKVMAGNPNFHFSYTELFSTDKKDYVGYVNENTFTIRRRRQLLDFSIVYAKAIGSYQLVGDKLEIKVEVKALYLLIVLYWTAGVVALICYLFLSYDSAIMLAALLSFWYWVVLFLAVIYWLPYIMIRNSITHLKIAIQQELIALI